MQRSKQQALYFLLGAVLVGGALGFTADRMLGDKHTGNWGPRQRMYGDLALTDAQRQAADSVLDEQNCQISILMKPVRPKLDSIRALGRQSLSAILTSDQQAKLEQRRAEMARRDSLDKIRRDSVATTKKTSISCRN
jgi:Spy/CpxP family protein refolding chaperone